MLKKELQQLLRVLRQPCFYQDADCFKQTKRKQRLIHHKMSHL